MSDLDQQLRELFRDRADTVGPPPPLPPALGGVPRSRWWKRHRQWLLVPAAVLITGAVVIPVALVRQNTGVTTMPAKEARVWALDVCHSQPSERSAGQDDIRTMSVVASAVCWYRGPENPGGKPLGLTGVGALTPPLITELQQLLVDAERDPPTCSMIDSPPRVKYSVYLRDSDGQDWRIDVPTPSCLGLELNDGSYSSAALLDWLEDVFTPSP